MRNGSAAGRSPVPADIMTTAGNIADLALSLPAAPRSGEEHDGRESADRAPASTRSGIVGILLAAGRARRFGSDKLIHPMADGKAMAVASADTLRAILPRTVAVVRADNHALAELFAEHRIEMVVAEHADSGMGASLAAGVAATADARGWIVALGDMPFILRKTVALVAEAIGRGAILAAPSYKGRRGHPVGFSAHHREALLALRGDEGARALIQQYVSDLVLIDCDDPGVLVDIDRA